jgi:hypothetical protein
MCAAVSRQLSPATRGPYARVAPLLWYSGVVIGIPILNRAWARDPERFLEHAGLTLGAGSLVLGLTYLVGALRDRLSSPRAPS